MPDPRKRRFRRDPPVHEDVGAAGVVMTDTKDVSGLVDHLFRREAGKMVSYLTRVFGVGNLRMAEDVVQDTLLRALETWPVYGVPENPPAWLMRVARNRAIDIVRRDGRFRHIAPGLERELAPVDSPPGEDAAFAGEIRDDQLRMMFSCCHPALSTEARMTLILKTLCGFGVAEIAHALLVSEDSVEKRLTRARNVLRSSGEFVEIATAPDIPGRLEAVYRAIYLLFSEGYHGTRAEETVREELCFEAIRLALLLSEHPESAGPRTHALLALFCFQAARLSGRTGEDGGLVQLRMQDRSKWDRDLIGRGFYFLTMSSSGEELSEFHIEAGIAALHCSAPSYEETDWGKILGLYDTLYGIAPSPIVALNRAVALGNAFGPDEGLAEIGKIPDSERLKNYPFYEASQGEFHLMAGRREEAARHFEKAAELARSPAEREFFGRRVRECGF